MALKYSRSVRFHPSDLDQHTTERERKREREAGRKNEKDKTKTVFDQNWLKMSSSFSYQITHPFLVGLTKELFFQTLINTITISSVSKRHWIEMKMFWQS